VFDTLMKIVFNVQVRVISINSTDGYFYAAFFLG
jgi:hypothetical protein